METDKEALMGFLFNESWKIRLLSLQTVEPLLTQNHEELKEIAMMLENDESQPVREQAGKILHRIKATELKDSSGKQ